MSAGVQAVMEIAERYGLTGMELIHYKTTEAMTYSGKLQFRMLNEQEVKAVATDLILTKKCLMIYGHSKLGVFIVVMKDEEEKK